MGRQATEKRLVALALAAATAVGCSARPRATPDVGAGDDAAIAVPDAGQDVGTGASDAGRDAASASDAGRDAASGATDGGSDAATLAADAATVSDAGTGRTLECVPSAGAGTSMSGMVFSPSFWVGFRFHVTSATSLTRAGLSLAPDAGGSGRVLAGLVTLTDGFDAPDSPDLTSSDVIATTLIDVPASTGPEIVSAPLAASLPVGWYALVFGTGSGGATLSGATVYSQSGGGGCTLPESSYPFSIRQSDGMLILQGATPYFFVTVDP